GFVRSFFAPSCLRVSLFLWCSWWFAVSYDSNLAEADNERHPGVQGVCSQGQHGRHGAFISTLLDFLIVAWAIFIVVKAMNKTRSAKAP
ncbi:MAG: MscL family protein, partial [Burkholderiales bacterium]